MDDQTAVIERQPKPSSSTRVPASDPSPVAAPVASAPRPGQVWRWALWVALVAALLLFLLRGSVPIGYGVLKGEETRVVDLWSRFGGLMRAWGFSGLLVAAVWVAGGVALLASLAALRLALDVPDETPRRESPPS